MRRDPIELDEIPAPPPAESLLTGLDGDAVQLSLAGGSVVEWSRLNFRSHDDVNAFLRLWGCDLPNEPWSRERLRYVYNQAVEYLEEHLGLHFANEVRRPRDVRDAFLRAGMRDKFSRHRIQYCAILKLVHVINHLEMQELRGSVAVRDADLIELANLKVLDAARRVRDEGMPVLAFYGNRKTRPSVITKLLAKRESTAATVFDKLRFRIVTERRDDVVRVIAWLFRNLVPFPAVIPGESHNNLLTTQEVQALCDPGSMEEAVLSSAPGNEHTGAGFRAVNFIVGLPVRIYDAPGIKPPPTRALLGEVVSVLTEFQVVDRATDQSNEAGESRHDLYKIRQMQRVYERLGRAAPKPAPVVRVDESDDSG